MNAKPNLVICRKCPRLDEEDFYFKTFRRCRGAYEPKVYSVFNHAAILEAFNAINANRIDRNFKVPANCDFLLEQVLDYEEMLNESTWQSFAAWVKSICTGVKKREYES